MAGKIVNLGPLNALFDLRLGKQMHVLSACGLGGGSLINAGLAFRPEPWVFEQQSWPTQIAGDKHLSKGFERAEDMLNVAPLPWWRGFIEISRACKTVLKNSTMTLE